MTYEPSNPIAGESLGTSDDWFHWMGRQGAKRLFDLELYLDTIHAFAPQVGLAAHMVVCQFIHETSEDGVPASSDAWADSLNPAGIGVTDDSKRNWHDFGGGKTAALAHLVHLCLYVFGTVPEVLRAHQHADPRLDHVTASILGKKKTLASFGGSTREHPTWAVDPDYGQKWADTLNETESLFAGIPTPPPYSSTPQSPPSSGSREKPMASRSNDA